MPSPFPGMDPWLEAPHLWPGFHHKLMTAAVEQLQPRLRERGYYVDVAERIWSAEPRRPIYPDNVVSKVHRSPTELHREASADSAGTSTLVVDEPVRVERSTVEMREPYLEVFEKAGHKLITGVEFVSPVNKSDATGRRLYEQKQQEMREAGIHLVEVDLIRRGPRVLDVPDEVLDEQPRWDYLVNTVRASDSAYEFYPIRLRNRLPTIRLPLSEDDSDVALELQSVFERAYEIGPYPERIDYTAAPPTPLAEDDADWADGLLRDHRLRE